MARRDDGAVNVGSFSWTNEAAWKLLVQFEQNLPDPSDLWDVKGVSLPAAGVYKAINLQTKIHNLPLVFKGITSADTRFPGEPLRKLKNQPRIHLEYHPPSDLFQF